ncbi:MAG TPA: DegT/DnrJ/EryC1/StrS family aminotransferase [Chloroflexota bacterium]|nr:DegT/DnrJ/EryC1/StrS family aminotransferase [Chloroflexota bacterium]
MMTLERRAVPFNVLAPGVAAIRPELDVAMARVLDSGWFLMGPELDAFERQWAAYHGPGFLSVGVGSGTDGLKIGLQALGIGPGDDVLVVANAGIPPVAALVATGARPVFCDVDPATHALDPAEIDHRITPHTRAVLVVHLYGHPAPMDAILERARANGLKVLEDCAQAHGAHYQGQLVGTFGDAAAFSFYPTKNLGALGDAGALLTADPEVAERARLLRMYGWRERYTSELHSTVSRLDELQAALLATKLPHLDAWNSARQALAAQYHVALDGLVGLPPPEGVFHLYVIRTAERDRLRVHLTTHGVGVDVHYPRPVHLQTPFAAFGNGSGSLPHTEQLSREILSLPIYPELAAADVAYVCQVIAEFRAA